MTPRVRRWMWVIPIILLAVWLASLRLDATPMWNDEFHSIRDAGGYGSGWKSPDRIWRDVSEENPWHGPAYFVVLNIWAQGAGWEVVPLRWLSVLIGILGIAMMYRLGTAVSSERVGLCAAVIFAASALVIDQMQDIRVHVVSATLTALFLWLYFRAIRPLHTVSSRWWLALVLTTGTMLYSHYFLAIPIAAVALYHLLFEAKTARWWKVSAAIMLGGVSFIPWFPTFLRAMRMTGDNDLLNATALDSGQVLARIVYLFSNGVPLLFIALAVASLTQRSKKTRAVFFLCFTMLALIIAAHEVVDLVAVSRFRYLMCLWPVLTLVAALGFSTVQRQPRLGALLLGAWLGIGIWNSADPAFAADQGNNGSDRLFRTHLMIRHIRTAALEDDFAVYVVPDSFSVEDNRNRADPYLSQVPVSIRVRDLGRFPTQEAQQDEYRTVVRQVGDQRLRLWTASMPDFTTSVAQEFEQIITQDEQFAMCEHPVDTNSLSLRLMARSPLCCMSSGLPAPIRTFGDGIALLAMEPLPAAVDAALPIGLAWSIDDSVPDETYSVSLQVLDSTGANVAQTDIGLDRWRYLCTTIALPVDHLPNGDYRLAAAVYNWQTLERLPGQDMSNGIFSDMLDLAAFTIARDMP